MAYIRLGTGDYFSSSRIGVFLTPNNAAHIDDNLLHTRLINFLLTGFIIEIEEYEYNNLKIDQKTFGNFPLQVVGVYNPIIIEPVETITDEPPLNPIQHQRHIVWPRGKGQWVGRNNTIAEFIDGKWEYHIPKDGWTVPVYALGVSFQYIGHYPSGYWNITDERVVELETIIIGPQDPEAEARWATEQYVQDVVGIERDARINQDNYILSLIQEIQANHTFPRASQVIVDDPGNYFQGTNVEVVLAELAQNLREQGEDIHLIETQIALILSQVQNIQNSLNSAISRAVVFLNTSQINFNHNSGYIPGWKLYILTNGIIDQGKITGASMLEGVLAEPHEVTFNRIKFSFPKPYPLVLVFNR